MPLLTIVFTDVVESSATKRDVSLGRDNRERDHAYLEKVQTRHFTLIRQCCQVHGGHEVSTMGDGFYLTFEDPVEAVRCAVNIQKCLNEEPIETPRGPLRLRIGIHSGFPEFFEGSWHGTDVDTTARVEATASERQILLSSRTYELVRHMTDVHFHRRGEFALKGVGRIALWEADWDGKGPRPTTVPPLSTNRRWLALAGAAVAAALAIGGWLFYGHGTHALTGKDTIVLADFTNTTSDPVFDGTLRQGLVVKLEQSPFLSLVSDQRIQQTLRMMDQSPRARLTPEIARELCQRVGSKAYIGGSIASLGSQYVLGLKAVNCRTGDTLAEVQERATGKEQVLGAMDQAGANLRKKLGESLSTIKKFDKRLEEATTTSLEALEAYTRGVEIARDNVATAIPSFQRALTLDPKFAMAYVALGTSYYNLGETSLAAENTRKAYELRERVTEWERFAIESRYYHAVTGDLEEARQSYELWARTYPRDPVPPGSLYVICSSLGQHDKALDEARKAQRLDPENSENYDNLIGAYIALNQLVEAQHAIAEEQAKKLDSDYLPINLYQLAFLQNDAAGMAKQLDGSAGKRGVEDELLALEAETAAYSGRLGKARELSRQAVASAEWVKEKEAAAGYEADAALWEALFGNAIEARGRVARALRLSKGRDVQYGAALGLAVAGDQVRAQALADDLKERFPEDTLVQFEYLPTIRAQLALSRKDYSRATEDLQVAERYELGTGGKMYSVYVRGEVYVAANQGTEAAVEFQKILDHRGIVVNEPIGALAHLGLARAYSLQGDMIKARAAYQDFFALWKDANTDIPILRQAKAEYAKLE